MARALHQNLLLSHQALKKGSKMCKYLILFVAAATFAFSPAVQADDRAVVEAFYTKLLNTIVLLFTDTRIIG